MDKLKLANPKMMDVVVPANMKVGFHQEEIASRVVGQRCSTASHPNRRPARCRAD